MSGAPAQDAPPVVAARWVRHLWRSSLHVRVITITILLGLGITMLLGSFLYQRIADGLVSERIATATQEAAQGTREAQSLFDSADRFDSESLEVTAYDTVQAIASPGDDNSRQVVLARALSNAPETSLQTWTTDGLSLADVPTELREALDTDSNHQQVMLVPTPDLVSVEPAPAVLVGARVQVPRAGPHDLYFFFPMNREQETLQLVQRTFLGGAVALALLVGVIAYAVTRMVVTPVRSAAHVSERLSHGELNERMPVRGEDDLARLATSFNQMADSLQSQIRQLEDLSRVQHRFVSDVSHELRTPLTTIRMAGEVLHASREDFQAPVARSAELLYEELDRFEALLTDLLEISRFDAGAAVLELEATDVREVVSEVVAGWRHLAQRHGSVLKVSAPEEPVLVDMDPRRVARILRNLVGNAIEHGEGRPIEVTIAENASSVAVSVRDRGIGLAPGQAAQVFERFWRADPARSRTTGGTGLGLAIAQEDAHLHHGWLQATGEPGRGACFRLTLPKRQGTVITDPPPMPPLGDGERTCPARAVVPPPDPEEPEGRSPAGQGAPAYGQGTTAEPAHVGTVVAARTAAGGAHGPGGAHRAEDSPGAGGAEDRHVTTGGGSR